MYKSIVRDINQTFRLSREEKIMITHQAKELNISVGEYIRRCLHSSKYLKGNYLDVSQVF